MTSDASVAQATASLSAAAVAGFGSDAQHLQSVSKEIIITQALSANLPAHQLPHGGTDLTGTATRLAFHGGAASRRFVAGQVLKLICC